MHVVAAVPGHGGCPLRWRERTPPPKTHACAHTHIHVRARAHMQPGGLGLFHSEESALLAFFSAKDHPRATRGG